MHQVIHRTIDRIDIIVSGSHSIYLGSIMSLSSLT